MHPCPKCGNSVPDDQAFCRNCGAAQTPARETPKSESAGWELGATIVGKNFPMTPPPRQTPPQPQPSAPPAVGQPAAPPPMPPVNTVAPATPSAQQPAAKSRKGLYIGVGVIVGGFMLLLLLLFIVLVYIGTHR